MKTTDKEPIQKEAVNCRVESAEKEITGYADALRYHLHTSQYDGLIPTKLIAHGVNTYGGAKCPLCGRGVLSLNGYAPPPCTDCIIRYLG